MIKVINVISDSNIGGAGRMLLTFLRNCNRAAFDITVVLPVMSKLCGELVRLGTRYMEVEGLAEKSYDRQSIKRLKEIFQNEKPDIVHTHASMSARIAAKRAGKAKIIYTRHSVFPNSRRLTTFPGKQIYGALNNHYADSVIAVSPAAKDNITETGVKPWKVTVIYNGVDALPPLSAEEKAAARKDYGLLDEDFVCGIFARLTPVKGHEYVLRAAEVLKPYKNIKILIAGAGEIETDLKVKVFEKKLDNVIFAGFVEKVERLMGAIDLQLNASYGTEATSLALLEGMSIGIPAVVTDFGGNPFVISQGENGLVIPQKNGQAMADEILKVYNSKELYGGLSERSKKIFESRFTSKIMTKNIEDLYVSVCKGE